MVDQYTRRPRTGDPCLDRGPRNSPRPPSGRSTGKQPFTVQFWRAARTPLCEPPYFWDAEHTDVPNVPRDTIQGHKFRRTTLFRSGRIDSPKESTNCPPATLGRVPGSILAFGITTQGRHGGPSRHGTQAGSCGRDRPTRAAPHPSPHPALKEAHLTKVAG